MGGFTLELPRQLTRLTFPRCTRQQYFSHSAEISRTERGAQKDTKSRSAKKFKTPKNLKSVYRPLQGGPLTLELLENKSYYSETEHYFRG